MADTTNDLGTFRFLPAPASTCGGVNMILFNRVIYDIVM